MVDKSGKASSWLHLRSTVPYLVRRVYRVCCVCQVPANDEYALDAMPVPVVLVVLKGGAGGRVIESESRKEIDVCEGGVFFLPADTPVRAFLLCVPHRSSCIMGRDGI